MILSGGIGGAPHDEAEAARLSRLAAERRNARGQAALAFMYLNWRGVPRDEAEALRLNRLAANQGLVIAQNNLVLMYAAGQGGLSRDYVEAVRLYRKAADQGFAGRPCREPCTRRAVAGSRRTRAK